MIYLAPAKTNLSLRVVRRREDGFHEIDSLMVPLALADELEIELTPGNALNFSCSDTALAGDDNLVVRAVRAFCEKANVAAEVRVHLKKYIPHGAGLGGGSSDAATTLLALDTLFATHLPLATLAELAASLGSDIPFFLLRGPGRCSGRGEIIAPVDFPHALPILLLKPPFGVPTPWAYQKWRDSRELPGVAYAAQAFPWGELVNDLERPVFEKHIVLAELKMWLLAQPEVAGALMSGSGSTTLALLHAAGTGEAVAERARAHFGENLWAWTGLTSHR